mgnify:CR=1 FL=1
MKKNSKRRRKKALLRLQYVLTGAAVLCVAVIALLLVYSMQDNEISGPGGDAGSALLASGGNVFVAAGAFNKFFIDYQQRFVHFACTYVHDEAVAEDFVVESMMYYWENKDRLSADTNIPAYVLTTIKHKCIDYLRHQQVYQDASDEIARIYAWELSGRIMTLEDFEPYEVFTKEIQEIVDRTLDALPEQTRKIFVMSRNENKSHKEIAELLDITTKGVEFHISKATRTLRLALKDYLPVSLLFFYLH